MNKLQIKRGWCDYGEDGEKEVVQLPTGGSSTAFLCKQHFKKEMDWRKTRNKTLSKENRFKVLKWKILKWPS